MPKQKLEVEIEVPDGYRCVGFGHALPGTLFLNSNSGVDCWNLSDVSKGQYFILERVERWRPATVEDVIRSLQGEDVKARFRGPATEEWCGGKLCGVREYDKYETWLCQHMGWRDCEVLDTPESTQ